jgi:hypothetical protein
MQALFADSAAFSHATLQHREAFFRLRAITQRWLPPTAHGLKGAMKKQQADDARERWVGEEDHCRHIPSLYGRFPVDAVEHCFGRSATSVLLQLKSIEMRTIVPGFCKLSHVYYDSTFRGRP